MANQPQKKDGQDVPITYCRRCKMKMENGVCKTCGFKAYVPMDKEKQQKIKLIGTAILMAVFVILFVVLQFKKG